MSKIVLDAIGGDHAPKEAVLGVASAIRDGHVQADQVVLTGPEAMVREAVQTHAAPLGVDVGSIEIVDAPDVLTADDTPTDALRKKARNSVAVGVQLVKEGKAEAFVSAGSTGTVVAAATLGLRCLEGIKKAAIGAIIHGEKHPFLVLDVGANPMPKAHHLAQFALMGSAYYQCQFGIGQPRVGLLNIGSEERKGSPLVREARVADAADADRVRRQRRRRRGLLRRLPRHRYRWLQRQRAAEGQRRRVAEYLLRTTFECDEAGRRRRRPTSSQGAWRGHAAGGLQ